MQAGNTRYIIFLALLLLAPVAEAQWVRSAKSHAFSRTNAVATDLTGNVYSAGIFTCITAFDADSLLNNSCGEITPPAPAVTQVDAFLSKRTEDGELLWVLHFPGSAGNKLFINDIATDPSGNCYLTGAYSGDLDLGAVQLSNPDATTEYFLARILADGTTDWAVSSPVDDLSETSAQKVAVTQNAVYITGAIRGDFQIGTLIDSVGRNASFVASFDFAGTSRWTKHFMEINANGNSRGKAIEAQGDSIWVFSSFTDSVRIEGNVYRPPGAVPTTAAGVICLYDASGNALDIMLTNTPFIEGIRLHRPDARVYITGRAENTTAINGDTLFNTAGTRAYVSSHSLDLSTMYWVIPLTASTPTALTTTDLDVNSNGSIYVAGVFQGTSLSGPASAATGGGGQSGFLAKIDNTGSDTWLQSYGGAGEDALLGVTSLDDDRIFVAGYFHQYVRVAGDEIYTSVSNGMIARIDVCPQLIAERITADTTFICERDTAILQVTDNAAYVYEWYRDGTLISGAATAALETNEAGVYRARITQPGCSKFTPVTRLVLYPLPDSVVLTNDALEKCEGQVVKLTGPVGAYTFQWLDSGAPIAETTRDISVVTDGDYQLRITDARGCDILSDTFSIRFHPFPSPVLSPPGGKYSLCSGNALVLQADQSQPGMSWQWRRNDIPLPGEVLSSYAVTTSGRYRAVIRNAIGCETLSEPDTVVVQASPLVDLNTEELPARICQGTTLRLVTPQVIGQTYQWQVDGADIPGSNTNVLDVNAGGHYAVRVNNALCERFSDTYELVVNPLPAAGILNAAPAAICEGDDYELTTQETSDYSYQWLKNDQLLPGEEQPALAIVASGSYSVRVTNEHHCHRTSLPTPVTVNLQPPAAITSQGPTVVCEGGAVTLLANAGTSFTYEWIKDAVPLATETEQKYEIAESASVQVRVTNSNHCSRISDPVEVQIVSLPTATLTSQTGINSFCERDSVELVAGTLSSYDFTWYFNDQPLNASSQTFFAKQAGSYRVVAAVGTCRDTSSTVRLQVRENPLPLITRNEAFLSIALFGNIQWYRDGEALPGANLQAIRADEDGEYRVNVVNAAGCSAWSDTVPICQPLPEIQNDNDVLTVSIAATAYRWEYNDIPIAGAALRQLTAQQSGRYSVVVVSNDGCTMETSAVTVCIPYPEISRDEFTGVLFASPNPAQAYQWYFGGAPIPDATTQVHIPEEPGMYAVEVKDLEGCIALSETFHISPVTGIEDPIFQEVRLYPNPAQHYMIIENPGAPSTLSLKLIDAVGREIKHVEIGSATHRLDVSDISPGVYTMVLRKGLESVTWRLVKD